MKKIRSNFVKESLLDYENLANTLKENTSSTVKDLLNEAVRETYNQILSESDEDENEFDVEEVEDTNSGEDASNDAESSNIESGEENNDFSSDDTNTDDTGSDSFDTETNESETTISDNGDEVSVSSEGTTENGDEWAEFDKYKVSDDEYDFSNAEDDEIVRVYKLLKDDDQVCVNVNDNKLNIKDNQTGAEYLIDLDSVNNSSNGDDVIEDNENDAFGEEDNDNENFMESKQRIFEIALNEYDSHVGYTDNYQKKDVMTTPGISEPGKNVNDWDAGVPKSKSKPWSSQKKSVAPFNGEKGKTVEEGDDVESTMEENANIEELKTTAEHAANNGSTSRTDGPNNPRPRTARSFHTAQNGQESNTGNNPYFGGGAKNTTNEAKVVAKAEKIFAENKELKAALAKFRNVLQEAAVTNVNLGQIVKLISENATTKAEKQEIIARFGKEAKTIEESKKLYSTISNELKKNNSMTLNEDKQFTANSSKMINETQIYQSKDLLNSLDMMHRICNI